MGNLSEKLASKSIKKAPVNVARPEVRDVRNAMPKGEQANVDVNKRKTLAGAVIEGARNSLKAKPLGAPSEASTTAGKVARAIGNTAIKAVAAPMETATNTIGAIISGAVKGTNTQAERRSGSIYKSSDNEIAARKAAQSDTGNQTKGFEYKLGSKK